MYNLQCIICKASEVFWYMLSGGALVQHNMKSCILFWLGGVCSSICYLITVKKGK